MLELILLNMITPEEIANITSFNLILPDPELPNEFLEFENQLKLHNPIRSYEDVILFLESPDKMFPNVDPKILAHLAQGLKKLPSDEIILFNNKPLVRHYSTKEIVAVYNFEDIRFAPARFDRQINKFVTVHPGVNFPLIIDPNNQQIFEDENLSEFRKNLRCFFRKFFGNNVDFFESFFFVIFCFTSMFLFDLSFKVEFSSIMSYSLDLLGDLFKTFFQ